MKLNRWTILAVILLLSTGVGLLFRPSGPMEGPPQMVEKDGLSLTCPEYLIKRPRALGVFTCVLVNESYFNKDFVLHGSWLSYRTQKEEFPNQYLIMPRFTWRLSQKMEIYAEFSERDGRSQSIGEDPANQDLIRPTIRIADNVDLRIKQGSGVYLGMGLLALQIVLVANGTLLELLARIASWVSVMLRSSRKSVSKPASHIKPPLFLVMYFDRLTGRDLQRESSSTGRFSKMAIQALWASYVVQLGLLTFFHIFDMFTVERNTHYWVYYPIILVLTVPAASAILAGLLGIEYRLFRRILQAEDANQLGRPSETRGFWRSLNPFFVAAIAGWLLLPLFTRLYLTMFFE